MCEDEFNRKSEIIQQFLESQAIDLSQEVGLVKRQRQLTGDIIAKMLIIGCIENPAATLSELAQVCDDLGIKVSPQAIDKRLNGACVKFMDRLLAIGFRQWCEATAVSPAVLREFEGVYIVDSTQIQLPKALSHVFAGSGGSASQSALKLQVMVDYQTWQFQAIEIGAGNIPDQSCHLPVEHAHPQRLFLFDQGYASLSVFAQIQKQQGFFLTRFDHQMTVYEDAQACHKIDLAAWLSQAPLDCYDREVYIGCEQRLPLRLVFRRCSSEAFEERCRLAHRREQKKGYHYSKAYYTFLAWTILVTNLPTQRFSSQQILDLYRLRWQIELTFKLWKSQMRLDVVRQWREERLRCQLMACLIGLLLFYWLVSPYRFYDGRELSFPKAFTTFRRHVRCFADALLLDMCLLPFMLQHLAHALLRFAFKETRIKSPSTYDLLAQSP